MRTLALPVARLRVAMIRVRISFSVAEELSKKTGSLPSVPPPMPLRHWYASSSSVAKVTAASAFWRSRVSLAV